MRSAKTRLAGPERSGVLANRQVVHTFDDSHGRSQAKMALIGRYRAKWRRRRRTSGRTTIKAALARCWLSPAPCRPDAKPHLRVLLTTYSSLSNPGSAGPAGEKEPQVAWSAGKQPGLHKRLHDETTAMGSRIEIFLWALGLAYFARLAYVCVLVWLCGLITRQREELLVWKKQELEKQELAKAIQAKDETIRELHTIMCRRERAEYEVKRRKRRVR